MKEKTIANSYLSFFCAELAMLVDAGLTINESIQILHEDEVSHDGKEVLKKLADELSVDNQFSKALRRCAVFPNYMIQMVEIGEKTGRIEETLKALTEYYDRQSRLTVAVKKSVLYPAIILVLMIVVVLVLIIQVLPIFSDVFGRLGTQMSPVATALMNFGSILTGASVVIAAVVALIFVFIATVLLSNKLRSSVNAAFLNMWGNKGIFGKIATSRFVYAMALSMASGLDTLDAIEIASNASGGSKSVDEMHKKCNELINGGAPIHEALTKSGILSNQSGKMLAIGTRSGKADLAMTEIARKSDVEVRERIDAIVGKIEPALVISSSVIVGVILMSVMLPLMGIMTSIG
ncbi:MAG: type II secretion system F family protein [Oscillospiraceae bacterium]|nr:type II secretion system F family protein [Oscillospiraceae bacterium]